jgi:hypothetical protein
LVFWPQDAAKVESIRAVLGRDDVVTMLKISGLWENTLQGGAKIKEYWNALNPGTGHVATLEMKGRDSFLVLTNENRMLGQMFKIYTAGASDEGLTRLAEAPAFQTWVGSGLGSANLLAWIAPGPLQVTTRRIAERELQLTGADAIDWDVERPRIERAVLAQHFPGETLGRVSAANQSAFEMRVQEEVDRFQATYLEQRLPALRAESERWLRALAALEGGFVELATDRKRLRLHARLALTFEAGRGAGVRP